MFSVVGFSCTPSGLCDVFSSTLARTSPYNNDDDYLNSLTLHWWWGTVPWRNTDVTTTPTRLHLTYQWITAALSPAWGLVPQIQYKAFVFQKRFLCVINVYLDFIYFVWFTTNCRKRMRKATLSKNKEEGPKEEWTPTDVFTTRHVTTRTEINYKTTTRSRYRYKGGSGGGWEKTKREDS